MEEMKIRRRNKSPFLFMFLCFLFSIICTGRYVLAEDEKTEILIGAHLPISGALAKASVEQRWAYEKAVEDINRNGGIYVKKYDKKLPVRLIIIDDETNPQKAAEVVEELITRKKVDLLLSGHTGAHGVLPGMVIAEKYNKYYHGALAWVPDFLEYDFKWSTLYMFDMVQGGAMPFEVMNTLPLKRRPARPALFIEDTFDGKQIGNIWVALAEKYGYKVVMWKSISKGARDFSAQIERARFLNVDAILLFANTEETIALVRQMKEKNLNIKFFHGMKGAWATKFYESLGEDAEYILCDGFWYMDYPYPGAKELGRCFYTENGRYSNSVGMHYALCQTLWQAIEKAGTLDSKRIRQAVLYNEFDTVMGKVDYDERGVALFPLAEFQWWKGKLQMVYPFEHSNFKVKVSPSWNKR